jgi:hypothetical protein
MPPKGIPMTATRTATTHQRRPRSVTVIAVTQWLIALAFLTVPLLGLIYGTDVQAAAEAEVVRQGQPAAVLIDNGLDFAEVGVALLVPLLVVFTLGALGLGIRAGKRPAQILSWIAIPLVLLGNIAIMASNASAAQTLQTVFVQSTDERLHRLDARAVLDAATAAYPDWLPYLTHTRNAVVLLGALLAIALLTLPGARRHFRKTNVSAAPTQ